MLILWTRVDEDRKLVEMTLRKNPPTKDSKQVVKMALGDFEEGQKVVATVKKVRVIVRLHAGGADG